MHCPNCQNEMERGLLRMEKPFLEFLSFGFGTRNVYFETEAAKQRELAFHWSQKSEAYRCGSCRTILFPESR